jgi:hypothetical protein
MTNLAKIEPADQQALISLLLYRIMIAIMSRLSNEEIKGFEQLNNEGKSGLVFTTEAEHYLREHIPDVPQLVRNELEQFTDRSGILMVIALSGNQQKQGSRHESL